MYDVKVEESAEVQEALQSIKDQFDSDEAYQEALAATGMSEEEYVEKVLEPNTLQTKLAEAVEAAEGNNTDVDAPGTGHGPEHGERAGRRPSLQPHPVQR